MEINLSYPTVKHREYVDYIKKICMNYHLSLTLEGSIARGKGKVFSDIDLIICGNMNGVILDRMITGYDEIVMTNYTENPKGIYILNYKNGISVDLDIRDSVLRSEMENEKVLCNFGFDISDVIIRKQIQTDLLPERPFWYKTMRLIHRGCIKYLCDKTEAANGLMKEVIDNIKVCCNNVTLNEADGIDMIMRNSFEILCYNYKVNKDTVILFDSLFVAMDKKYKTLQDNVVTM